jgi:hypothetical protein
MANPTNAKNEILKFMDELDDLEKNLTKPKIPPPPSPSGAIVKPELPRSEAPIKQPIRNERIMEPLQEMQFPNQKLTTENMLAGVYENGHLVEGISTEFESEPIETQDEMV